MLQEKLQEIPAKVEKTSVLRLINEANRPYFIMSNDGQHIEPLNSLDCIRIYIQSCKLKKDPRAKSLLFLPFGRIKLSLNSM